MTGDPGASNPPAAGSGQPTDISRETPFTRALDQAVKTLETHRIYAERDLAETRKDMRDVRDRVAKLEVKVDALPSKLWIGSVVAAAVALISSVVGLVKLVGH